MIKHGMDIQRQAVEYLNPGQIPVIKFDQPLFTLTKFVQWKWPATHEEQVHVVMMGGLHLEMVLRNTMGDVLECCGWISSLTEAEVASNSTDDSMLKATHLTRTRYAHQVTLLALLILQREALLLSSWSTGEEPAAAWQTEMVKKSPTFMLWDLIMRYETLILIFYSCSQTELLFVYRSVGTINTDVLCLGSCKLFRVDTCPLQRRHF